MDIIEIIREKYDGLTKKQKQVVDYMIKHIEKMSFMTMKELSSEINVTEVTLLNTCAALGFSSFKDVKYEVRKYLGLREKLDLYQSGDYTAFEVPGYELKDKSALLRDTWHEEEMMWREFSRGVDAGKLFSAAEEFLKADCAVLCGRGISKILAEFLSVRLAALGLASTVMDTELNDSMHAALPLIGGNSLTVVFSFPEYYFMTQKVAEYAKGRGSTVLAITDSKRAEILQFADFSLIAQSRTRLFLNTISVPAALLNLLTTAIDIERGSRGEERPEQFEQFDSLFAPPGPDRKEKK